MSYVSRAPNGSEIVNSRLVGVTAGGGLVDVLVTSSGAVVLAPLANERDIGTSNAHGVSVPECNITRCDIDQTETLVTNTACIVLAVIGNDGNTGYTDLIDAAATGGGSTPKARVNVGDGVSPANLWGAKFINGLCVDGESVGHDVSILWRPLGGNN